MNNAGYATYAPAAEMSDDQSLPMLDPLLTAASFRLLRAAAPYLAAPETHVPRMINVSAVAGISALPGSVGYAVAKAGLHGSTRTLAKEWAPWVSRSTPSHPA